MYDFHSRVVLVCLMLVAAALQAGEARADNNAGKCKPETQDSRTKLFAAMLTEASSFFAGEQCKSAQRVLGLLSNTSKSGGRQLKPGEKLNVADAERELAEAAKDKDYTKELRAQQQGESDPQKRKFIEAVLLDSFGYMAARDLRVQQMGL